MRLSTELVLSQAVLNESNRSSIDMRFRPEFVPEAVPEQHVIGSLTILVPLSSGTPPELHVPERALPVTSVEGCRADVC